MAFGLLFLSVHVVWSQDLGVERSSLEADGRFVIDFVASPGADQESFTFEAVTELGEAWTLLGDAGLEGLGSDAWRATAGSAETTGPQRFFRVRQGGEPLGVSPTALEAGDLMVDLTQPYRGTLDYTVEFLDGTGRAPLTGQVFVDGSSFSISLPDLSDGSAGEARNLALSLSGAEGTFGRFRLGDGRVRTVLLEDDDSEWAGLLTPDDERTELALQVFIQDSSEGFLRTTATPFFPPNPAPDSNGDWPAQDGSFAYNIDTFEATFGPITIAGGSDMAVGLDTELTLVLTASGSDVAEKSISGTFALTTNAPSAQHLQFEERTGTFTLIKLPAVPADVGL